MDTLMITKELKLSKSEYIRALRRIVVRRNAAAILFLWLILGYLTLGSASDYSASTFWIVFEGWSPLLLIAAAWTLAVLFIWPWRLANSRYSRPVYQTHRYRFEDEGILRRLEQRLALN